MNAAKVISNLLRSDVTTTGLVGDRIFPDVAPQTEIRPSIVFQEVSRIPNNTLGTDGQSSLDVSRIQLIIFSTSRDITEQIADQCRVTLDGVNQTTVAGVPVNWCRFDSGGAFFDQSGDLEGLYCSTQTYKIAIQL